MGESKDFLLAGIGNFFAKRFPRNDRPLKLVLGLSGGSDSMALWHLLMKLGTHCRFIDLTCVHVDHGWREESGRQALSLQRNCEKIGQDLRVFSIQPFAPRGNLEAHWRQQRLEIFQKVVEDVSAEALVLAHHAGDRIEGMLKRIFEGCELAQLRALVPDKRIGALRILRPLLHTEKSALVDWLKPRNIEFVSDSSNLDPRFWRGFVRTSLLHQVQAALGKELQGALCRLADFSEELSETLDDWWQNLAGQAVQGFLGTWIPLPENCPPLVLRHALRKTAESLHSNLPIEAAHRIAVAVENQRRNARVDFCNLQVIIEGKDLFFLSKLGKGPRSEVTALQHITQPGNFKIGCWHVLARRATNSEIATFSRRSSIGWQDLWSGAFETLAFGNSCSLALPRPGMHLENRRQSIFSWWGKGEVPSFLRSQVPVVLGKRGVAQQWLRKCAQSESLPREGNQAVQAWHLRFESKVTDLGGTSAS